MVNIRDGSKFLFLTILIAFLVQCVDARRKLGRRSNVIDPAPLAQSGWTVPLEGGETCTNSTHCTDMLTGPPATSALQYLAIGRGTITYTCAGQADTEAPLYVQQDTYLYDAAPLIPKFSSEAQFHSYIPRFLEYDYTSLDNSSLSCIGNVQTINNMSVFDLYKVDAFPVQTKEVVNSPDNSQFDLKWAHSQDDGNEWAIYRVETAGGGPPYNCGGQIINDEIPVEYVAEYWFYQKKVDSHEGR